MVIRIADDGDDATSSLEYLIDVGPPRPDEGEGSGVRGPAHSAMLLAGVPKP